MATSKAKTTSKKASKAIAKVEIIKDETHIDPQPQVRPEPKAFSIDHLSDDIGFIKENVQKLDEAVKMVYILWYVIGEKVENILKDWYDNKPAYVKSYEFHNPGKKFKLRPQNAKDRRDNPDTDYFFDLLGLDFAFTMSTYYRNYYKTGSEHFVDVREDGTIEVLENAPNITNLKDAAKYSPEDNGGEGPEKATYMTDHLFDKSVTDKITIRGFENYVKTTKHGAKTVYKSKSMLKNRTVVGLFMELGRDGFAKVFNLDQTKHLINALESHKSELIADMTAATNAKRRAKKAVTPKVTAKEQAMADMADA